MGHSSPDAQRAQAASVGVGTGVGATIRSGVGGGSDSNCGSVSDDRGIGLGLVGRGAKQDGHGIERIVPATNSSSPSNGEYTLGLRNEGGLRGEGGFDRSSSGPGGVRGNKVEESQSNDWEAVVDMYTTGKGTEDGLALKMITKGDGRRVSDRKLLEKRRTIGKTYECLGAERFEAAIGYKWENGVRRKQKMYHVISRCRVVNAMRKAGEAIPTDFNKLTTLIDERLAQKEAMKEAGKALANARSGNIVSGGGVVAARSYSWEDLSRRRAVGGCDGESRGRRTEVEGNEISGRMADGNRGREEDEITPGRFG